MRFKFEGFRKAGFASEPVPEIPQKHRSGVAAAGQEAAFFDLSNVGGTLPSAATPFGLAGELAGPQERPDTKIIDSRGSNSAREIRLPPKRDCPLPFFTAKFAFHATG
jgi:hypothetical protein